MSSPEGFAKIQTKQYQKYETKKVEKFSHYKTLREVAVEL